MSSDIKINESPPHFMVLDALSKGNKDLRKISKVTKMNTEEVEIILNDLAVQRLVIKKEKRGFFGNKKIDISITETGIRLLNSKKEELEQKWNQAQRMYNNGKGDKAQLQTFMEQNRSWMPLMLFMGITDMLFFMTMMSFVGMTLNPMEHSMAGDTGTETSGETGSEMEGTDTGDFGGFDGGGFGDF
jgi:hypothetical protein